MNYTAFLIRRQRLEKGWSQQGLCEGICAVSYLSKIEQGKAEPSGEIVRLLFERLGISWHDEAESRGSELMGDAFEYLLSGENRLLADLLKSPEWEKLRHSPWLLDCQLLEHCLSQEQLPLDPALEVCMNQQQLALQRRLQGHWEEALRLWPTGWMYLEAGENSYWQGNNAQAIELLQMANDLASQEGRPRIMLDARSFIGNCYCTLHDFFSMERHYKAARRLAIALNEPDFVSSIEYNAASNYFQLGQYEKALAYFESLKDPQPMALHKLALCYEKLGRTKEALAALDRAFAANEQKEALPQNLLFKMCELIRLRLEDPAYLDSEQYGKALTECFTLCRENLPMSFCVFHLPWMLEWYEHHRQYKQAYALLMDFPEYHKSSGFNRDESF